MVVTCTSDIFARWHYVTFGEKKYIGADFLRVGSTGVGLDRIFIFVVSDPSILPIWPLLIAL